MSSTIAPVELALGDEIGHGRADRTRGSLQPVGKPAPPALLRLVLNAVAHVGACDSRFVIMTKAANEPELAPTSDIDVSRVLHRDGLMLVVDKPAGIPVHRGPRNSRDKSGAALEDLFRRARFGLPRPPVLAHRLDRDTSGCLVLGRHRKATASLGLLFKHSKIAKTYWAVVEGGPDATKAPSTSRSAGSMRSAAGGRSPIRTACQSTTRWKVLGRRGDGEADLARARADHRPHASIAGALRGHGLADRRRQHLRHCARDGGRDAAPACARDHRAAVEEQAAGAGGRAGAGAYARATEAVRVDPRSRSFRPLS